MLLILNLGHTEKTIWIRYLEGTNISWNPKNMFQIYSGHNNIQYLIISSQVYKWLKSCSLKIQYTLRSFIYFILQEDKILFEMHVRKFVERFA